MGDLLTVIVLDCNGIPIERASVVFGSTNGSTNINGTLSVTPATTDLSLTISHPLYVTERIDFIGTIKTGIWNNALLQRTVDAGQTVLTVRLGRCSVVPTVFMTENEVDELAVDGKDPHKALLFDLPGTQGRQAYRGQLNEPLAVELVEPWLLPDPPPTGKVGWRRFLSSPANPAADPAQSGRFFYLFHPATPQQPQFVVAVWSPNLKRSTPSEPLDMVVYFSPNPYTFTAKYPFGVTKDSDPGNQSHLSECTKYLLNEFGFAYNLIARQRQAVIVMPIWPSGKWGPYLFAQGVFRICREVALFLHRECRTSNLCLTSMGGVDKKLWLTGASLRSAGVGIWASDFGVPPQPGRIVLSAFSAAIQPIKLIMMNGWSMAKWDPRIWGCPQVVNLPRPERMLPDPEKMFTFAWREIWDLDGFHPTTGGWPNYLTLLNTWDQLDSGRMIRLFHSQGRSPPEPNPNSHALWRRLFGEGPPTERNVPQNSGMGAAHELHGYGLRWSVVRLDNEYITNSPSVGTPVLNDDPHHSTPIVGWSHCVALSPIGT